MSIYREKIKARKEIAAEMQANKNLTWSTEVETVRKENGRKGLMSIPS